MAVAFPPPHVMALSKVQRLYDACDVVFSSPAAAPTLGEIRWLQQLLDGMEAADVGIDDGERTPSSSSDDEQSPKSGRLLPALAFTRITYVHIHQSDDFSIGVFCFPAGATLPLHDHPEMVVLSKLLYGSVRVRSYDWVTELPCSTARKCGLARVVAGDEVRRAPCEASVLFPRSGGNLHAFTAVTPCAILDVLTPPYSEEQGRPSTYFNDVPIPSLPGFAFLEETDLPEDFNVAGAPYLGPDLTVDMDDDDDDDYDDYDE
ncbi:plant cysteine oxidase 1-like [Phragmites australis]|uniref:plant cysteine oxidase 1-like n=1 Tax=Phragmites australis TaxID=29695 RepID=UPI002D77065D|nr:plant cysteine oxidase 1-like [Phragmites australis]